jgi:DNA gyrase subunit A
VAQTHDTLLCFSNHGRVYWLKVYKLPLAGRGGRGKPIVNLLPLAEGERISAMLPIREYADDQYVFMATRQGTVKKVPLEAFSRPRASGIIAVGLDEGDQLAGVELTNGSHEVMLLTTQGKSIRFHESDVRAMGREATGVRGITVSDGHEVNALIVLKEGLILTVSENGFGKLTDPTEWSTQGRGGQGVIALQLSERNGRMVGALQVHPDDDLLLISQNGTLVRTAANQVSIVGRNTQGVRLMRLDDGDKLVSLARIDAAMAVLEDEDGALEESVPVDGATEADATPTTPTPEG